MACQRRKRHIESLPIDQEERETLKELAENDLRDRIHDLISNSDREDFDFGELFENQ